MTGRAEERLSFDVQREMAVRLGYTAHPGLKDVERFMKHYFLVAKDVGDLTRIFCAALEEHHGKPVAGAQPLLRPRPAAAAARFRASTDFVVDNDRINIAERQGLRARSGQPHPHLPPRRPLRPRTSIPTRCSRSRARSDLIDAQAPRRPGGQPPLPRDPVVAQPAGARAPRA